MYPVPGVNTVLGIEINGLNLPLLLLLLQLLSTPYVSVRYAVAFPALPGPLLMATAKSTVIQSLPAPPVEPDRSSSSDAQGPMAAGPDTDTAGWKGSSGCSTETSTSGDADAHESQTFLLVQ